jgi:hypothetical protein
MKKSVFELMEEAIIENNIDLNSHFKSERMLLVDKICDKINWSDYNRSQAERKVNVIEKMVMMKFDKK